MKKQKGITLVALIITIVVLLILAVVAITSIQNEGILTHANNAATEYNQAISDEQGFLDEYEGILDKYSNGGTVGGGAGDGSTGVSVSGQTWVFKDNSITYTEDFTETVSFTSDGSSFSSISLGQGAEISDNDLYPQITYGSTVVYVEYALGGIPTWKNNDYGNTVSPWQTIKFAQGATVSQEFYTWLTANATQSTTDSGDGGENESDNTVSGVWVFNDTLDISNVGYEYLRQAVNFTSCGVEHSSFGYGYDMGFPWFEYKEAATLSDGVVWYSAEYAGYFGVTAGWTNNAYKTVDFGTSAQEVSEEFKTWLEANATKQQ